MTALIIPAYKPDEKLLKLLENYEGTQEYRVIVVNDGSGEECDPIFEKLPEWVTLLTHEVNRGKGAALKTAMKHILENMPDCEIAVTADSDGQHTPVDIDRVCAAAKGNLTGLTMGCRAFKGKVPARSLLGNGITRGVFAAVSGADVSDTQTGLRAFGRTAMERFAQLPGDRYEYEINMLLDAAENMPIAEVPIETIYIEENASSHFDPLRDSAKIYRCILKYAVPSLIAIAAETLIFALLCGRIGCGLALLIALAAGTVIGELTGKRSGGTRKILCAAARMLVIAAALTGAVNALGIPSALAYLCVRLLARIGRLG